MSSPPQMSSRLDLVMSTKTEKSLCKNSFILNMKQKNHSPSLNIPISYKTNLINIQSHVHLNTRDSSELVGATEKLKPNHTRLQKWGTPKGGRWPTGWCWVLVKGLWLVLVPWLSNSSLSQTEHVPSSSGKEFSRRCYTQICYSLKGLSIRIRLVILVGGKKTSWKICTTDITTSKWIQF